MAIKMRLPRGSLTARLGYPRPFAPSTLVVTVRNATCALVLGAALVVVAGVAGQAGAATREPPRLDDLRWLGSHNSYHLRPERELIPNEPADYAHAPLD